MKRLAALLLIAAVVGSAWLVTSAPSATAQNGRGELPDGWSDWDSDGDGGLTGDEVEALTEEDWEEFRDWVQAQLEENGGDRSHADMREWLEDHVIPPPDWGFVGRARVRNLLGVAASGLTDVPGDVAENLSEAPGDIAGAVGDAAGSAASNAATSAFESIANSVGEAAGDLVGRMGEALAPVGQPDQLDADWYREHYQRMLGWAGLIMVPLAMVAIGGAVLRGETSRIGEVLLEIPTAYGLGVLAIGIVAAAGGLSTAMANSLAGDVRESSTELGGNTAEVLVVSGQMGPGLVLLLGLVIALAALATLVWLVLTEAAVYAVVLFAPLAFAGRVWQATAGWGRKLLTVAFALIAAKVVIFGLWALAVDGLADATGAGGTGVTSAVAVAALLVMTAASPVAVLRLVPMVEGAEQAGSPGRTASQGLTLTYHSLSLARMGGAIGGGRSAGGRLPVSAGGGGAATVAAAGSQAQPAPSGSVPQPQPAGVQEQKGQDRGTGERSGPAGTSQPAGADRGAGGSSSRSGGGTGSGDAPGTGDRRTELPGSAAGRGSTGGSSGPALPPGTGDGKPWRRT